MDIDRDRVLFLVAKLGITGTEDPLNDLLLQYGDKKMAEAFMRSRVYVVVRRCHLPSEMLI